jgi:YhcH/YjgK/YiaL family protein
MKKTTFIVFTIIISVMAYSGTTDTTYNTTIQEKQEWFEQGEWHSRISAQPDASVDIEALYAHYTRHTDLWEQVFNCLAETDLADIEKGRYPIAGDSLFMIVDEYHTQDAKERKYEAHRKYIDLQYVISGQELIGIAKLDKQGLLEPYDKDRDIAFFSVDDGEYRLADNSVFFVFFPDDAHQPCVNVDQNAPVRKIVFKIISD